MRGDHRESAGDALITLWHQSVLLHQEMSFAYDRSARFSGSGPGMMRR